MRRTFVGIAVLAICVSTGQAREKKESDSNLIYDQSKIPHYDLPPLLVTAEGEPVTTAEQWRNVRRPQILSLFSNLVYGRVPAPPSPIKTEYKVLKTDADFMKGKATRKDIQIRFSNKNGSVRMTILVFTPNAAKKPVPAFMKHSFDDTKSKGFDVHPVLKNSLRNRWPLGEFMDRGYAFIAVHQRDLVGHNEVEFLRGIHKPLLSEGSEFPQSPRVGRSGSGRLGRDAGHGLSGNRRRHRSPVRRHHGSLQDG